VIDVRPNRSKIFVYQVSKFQQTFVLRGHELAHTNVWKIPQRLVAGLYLR